MVYNFIIFEKPFIRPVFWMDETSGQMKDIVQRFFEQSATLSDQDFIVLKEYILQWCMAPPFHQVPDDYLTALAEANTKEELKHMYDLLLDINIDPF